MPFSFRMGSMDEGLGVRPPADSYLSPDEDGSSLLSNILLLKSLLFYRPARLHSGIEQEGQTGDTSSFNVCMDRARYANKLQ